MSSVEESRFTIQASNQKRPATTNAGTRKRADGIMHRERNSTWIFLELALRTLSIMLLFNCKNYRMPPHSVSSARLCKPPPIPPPSSGGIPPESRSHLCLTHHPVYSPSVPRHSRAAGHTWCRGTRPCRSQPPESRHHRTSPLKHRDRRGSAGHRGIGDDIPTKGDGTPQPVGWYTRCW